MTQAQKRRLGRGLAALIGDDTSEEAVVQDVRNLRHMPIEQLRPNPNNPRKTFDDDDLRALARSISEKGILQPLVVRPKLGGSYEIVAGERRWRAAQHAAIHEVPVLIRELTDGETLEIALVENIQRTDLNPIEEARGYGQLMNQFGYTQQRLAESVGKSRSHIANTLRLMTLPEEVRQHIERGRLTAGHARALVATDAPGELAARIIAEGLNVRDAEELAREGAGKPKKPALPKEKHADVRALEKQLGEALGLKIEIADKGHGTGQIVIRYKTLDQLDDVCRRLSRGG